MPSLSNQSSQSAIRYLKRVENPHWGTVAETRDANAGSPLIARLKCPVPSARIHFPGIQFSHYEAGSPFKVPLSIEMNATNCLRRWSLTSVGKVPGFSQWRKRFHQIVSVGGSIWPIIQGVPPGYKHLNMGGIKLHSSMTFI
jgi:hypothetical protein